MSLHNSVGTYVYRVDSKFKQKIQRMKYNKKYTVVEKDITYDCEVSVDTEESYGHFEVYDVDYAYGYHAEGGLWFEGNVLRDYDGVYELPKCVIKTLEQWNFNLEDI
jgi:hypothetical protein